MPEIRFDAECDEDLSVLDAHVNATGSSRKAVMEMLLRRWVDEQVHTAILVLRAKRINPLEREAHRNAIGTVAEPSKKWAET